MIYQLILSNFSRWLKVSLRLLFPCTTSLIFSDRGFFSYCSSNFHYKALNRNWKKGLQNWHNFFSMRGFTALSVRNSALRVRLVRCARRRAASVSRFSYRWERVKKPLSLNKYKLVFYWNEARIDSCLGSDELSFDSIGRIMPPCMKKCCHAIKGYVDEQECFIDGSRRHIWECDQLPNSGQYEQVQRKYDYE